MENLRIGVVTENDNKEYPGQVRVELPPAGQGDGQDTPQPEWMPVLASYAGPGYGLCALPEVGDTVVVAGVLGGPEGSAGSVVLGSLWAGGKNLPRACVREQNAGKGFVSRGGHKVTVDDSPGGGMVLETAKGLRVELSDEQKSLVLTDERGKTKITLDAESGCVNVACSADFTVKSGGKVKIEGERLELKGVQSRITADKNIRLEGDAATVEAKTGLELKGGSTTRIFGATQTTLEGGTSLTLKSLTTRINSSASATVDGGGMLTLRGGMIKLN